jgi:thiol-disulfide isomerase/thioredoxin
MNTHATIGECAPELQIEKWMQGEPTSLPQLRGKVVLIEVFQVNCPGCFVHALPEVVRLHENYKGQGLVVIGLATAFEDFDKNTEANLQRLLQHGELIGDPLHQLGNAKLLENGKLDYRLDFPIALDEQQDVAADTSTTAVRTFILSQLPEFDTMAEDGKAIILQNARNYLAGRTQLPLTFTRYNLQGTPASILVDRQGILRDVSFGWNNHLEPMIQQYLHSEADAAM